jgi:vacuolar-type H+-ATPase subunit C/Vma6
MSFFLTNVSTPMSDLLPRIPDDVYRRILTEANRAFRSMRDLSALDKLADDFLIQYLQPAKHFCFGVEPLVAYLAAKENEVMRLRVVLHGKEKSLSADSLREVCRASYA